MKKALLATVSGLVITAVGVGLASARTQPACLGTARTGAQVTAFSHSPTTCAVTVALPAGVVAGWELGLVIDGPGAKQVDVSARAIAAGSFVRIVTADGLGLSFGATAFQAIPVGGAFVELSFVPLATLVGDVLFVDAVLANGASILRAQFNP